MTVRSQALIQYHGTAAGTSGAFSCPQGYIVLVKSAHYQNNTSTATDVRLLIGLLRVPITMIGPVVNVPANAQAEWNGWFVLNGGDYIQVQTMTAACDALVSGAILAGPALFAPATTLVRDPVPAWAFELGALPSNG